MTDSAWHIRRTTPARAIERWEIADSADRALSFATVVLGWHADERFRAFWHGSLRDAGFGACCWECPPLTSETSSRDFECVFVPSPALARMPADPGAFAAHFRADRSVVAFGNLGGDAVLVAPCPGGAGTDYAHLASFTATAPAAQQDALWQAVGQEMKKRVGSRPVWLSTAGLGVAWLHIRLDDRPKYYRHAPYARD